jgi:hypothetical protein
MQPPPEMSSAQQSVSPNKNVGTEAGEDINALLHSAVGTTRATLALATTEAKLASKSIFSWALWMIAAFLLALTSWWLLCVLTVACAYALGTPLSLSLAVLLMLHAVGIFFVVKYLRRLTANMCFAQTRAQLAAIAQALPIDKSQSANSEQ